MDEAAHYEVSVRGDRVIARARIGPLRAVVDDVPRPNGSVVLRVETRSGGAGPDIVVLGFEDDGGDFQVLAELDGRYLSTEVAGGFLGRVIGMYAVEGDAVFDWFDYEALDAESVPQGG